MTQYERAGEGIDSRVTSHVNIIIIGKHQGQRVEEFEVENVEKVLQMGARKYLAKEMLKNAQYERVKDI